MLLELNSFIVTRDLKHFDTKVGGVTSNYACAIGMRFVRLVQLDFSQPRNVVSYELF